MKDKTKTKEQLIAELAEMRQRIAGLKAAETERVRAEEALRETSDYLEKLFDYANAPIIVWDTELKITRFNHAFERLSGYTAGQVIGQELHLLFPNTSRDKSLNEIERTSSGEYWESVEIPILRQDGDIRLVLWNSANIHAEDGATVIATIAQGTDITERVRAEEALRQHAAELEARNEELDAFAHTVAHDLKNPLGLVIGFAEELEEHHTALPADNLRGYLHNIAENSRKMNSIIDELLLLASVRGIEKVEMRSLDMASIMAETQRRLANLIEEHEAKIIVPENWPLALGYDPWVEEVWTNYISNAIQHGGRPPRVELGFDELANQLIGESAQARRLTDSHVRFWVRDNGAGLTPEEQGRLFRPFEQLDPTSDRGRVKGHGLGLSIVLRIMKKLGGEVGVESQVGQGSTFWFILPAYQGQRTAKPPWS
ncbi:MAG: PAS domain-containing sensor histidine kinase [Chloroflexota bacterium]|nr:PAS domain-containing sensor histidine kinase [Chloroflexota bacterium]